MMRVLLVVVAIGAFVLVGCDSSEEPETQPPTVASIEPPDGTTGASITTDIAVTFSKPMDAATVQANYSDTQCSGTVRLSSDEFATCVRFVGGTASNENRTYTFTPILNLSSATTYEIQVTTGVADANGNHMSEAFLSEFTTQ
jgi:hypothetical protein